MARLLLAVLWLLAASPHDAAEWEAVKADPSCVWGEGWGPSVEEADRQALAALASRVSVAVTSGFRQVEEQVRSSQCDDQYALVSSRMTAVSSVTLPGTHRIVLREGRRAHVGRWIRRDDMERALAGRVARVLEYEKAALCAEEDGRVGDALKYRYWAYALLRTLPRASELRGEDGTLLMNALPAGIDAVLESLKVKVEGRSGDRVRIAVTSRGLPVRKLDFRYFDGARWLPGPTVTDGRVTLEMAPGALAETIQLKIEYAYAGDTLIDEELREVMTVSDTRPLKRSYIFIGTR